MTVTRRKFKTNTTRLSQLTGPEHAPGHPPEHYAAVAVRSRRMAVTLARF
jgi:hypothetical protein